LNTNSPAISPSRGFLTECALFLIEKPSPNGTFGSGVTKGIGGHHPPWDGSAVSNEYHQMNPDPMGTFWDSTEEEVATVVAAREDELEATEGENAREDEP
jgi:hypothetical protein